MSSDLITPSDGAIDPASVTDVTVSQTVLDSNLVIEIVDGSTVLLRFRLANN